MFKLGIDIGGTKINLGILDQNNNLIITKKLYIKNIQDIIFEIKNTIDEMCIESSVSYNNIVSCGVGIPGTVSVDGKNILKTPNITILPSNFLMKLERCLNIPSILIQDSRAGAYGEYFCGSGQNSKTLICVTIGTGIGTGIIIDGKIYNGALNTAGELGHIPIIANGRQCGCGKQGCLEKYYAGVGLDLTAKEMLGNNATVIDLFTQAKQGNQFANKVINDAIVNIGNAIVTAINLLSPDCLLLGGSICEQIELFTTPLIKYINTHHYSLTNNPKIELCLLGEYAPLIGSAIYGYKTNIGLK